MKRQMLPLVMIGIVLLISGFIATSGGSPTAVPTQVQATITPTTAPTATATVAATPTPTPAPAIVYPQYLVGFVVDDLGNRVPDANVTLLQNGQMLKYSGNPQYSGDGLSAPLGAYYFIIQQDTLQPGGYQILAVKGSFMGSIIIDYNGTTVNKNIRIPGYVYVPPPTMTPTPTASVTYPQYLTGLVLDCNGYSVPYANVTLWQNGYLVSSPNNPQLSSAGGASALGFYNFTINRNTLQTGEYRIMAEMGGQSGNITVNYAGSSVYCNVSIPSYAYVNL
jgi:hypothetical protein